MIKGAHLTYFTAQADAMRAFFRDRLRLPATDVGEGWLIFDLPDAELGVHPFAVEGYDPVAPPTAGSFVLLSFYCDDIHETMRELRARGVEFTAGVADVGYALSTRFRIAGDAEAELYQPRYARAPRGGGAAG